MSWEGLTVRKCDDGEEPACSFPLTVLSVHLADEHRVICLALLLLLMSYSMPLSDSSDRVKLTLRTLLSNIIKCKYLADASAGVFSISDLHYSSLWLNSPLNSSYVWKKWPQASSGSQRPCNLWPQREEVPLSEAHFSFWEITMSLSHVFVLTESKRWALRWQLG